MVDKPSVRASNEGARQEQRDLVDEVVALSGLELSKVAERIQRHHTVLTNFMNRPGHKGLLGAVTVFRLKALKRQLEEQRRGASIGFREEGAGYQTHEASLRAYLDAIEGHPDIARVLTLGTQSLEGIGFRHGDLVIVDYTRPAKPGEPVCADLRDPTSGAVIETVFRLFEPPYLVAASIEREFRRPIEIDRNVAIRGPIARLPDPTRRNAA